MRMISGIRHALTARGLVSAVTGLLLCGFSRFGGNILRSVEMVAEDFGLSDLSEKLCGY